MNEMTTTRMNLLASMFNTAIELDENKANDLITGTYGMLQVNVLNPSEIKDLPLENLDNIVAGAVKANALTETTTIQLARIFARYYNEYKENKSVIINGETCKTQQSIGEKFGLNKQRTSDFAHIATLPIIFDDNYKSWTLGRFVAAYDVINTKKPLFKGKYTIEDITPLLTIGDMDKMLTSAPIDTTVNENAGSENAGGENAGGENAGGENAGGENAGGENIPTKTEYFDEKIKAWKFNGATATQLQNWLHENITTAENADKMLIGGTIVIKSE